MVKKQTPMIPAHTWYLLAVGRIMLGFVFLWAFLDKLFGLGVATPTARAWVNGGSPTTGFLKGVEGPFAGFFNALSGSGFADWLFMLGLVGIGLALILGIGMRIAAATGSVLLFMMWAAAQPLENNPLIDEHLIYIVLLIALASTLDYQKWSIATFWQSLPFVKKYSLLR